MPFGIHPEQVDEVKVPFIMPVDKNDHEGHLAGGTFDFPKTPSWGDDKIVVFDISKKRDIDSEWKQTIRTLVDRTTLEQEFKN